ncbi:MAG TPA: amino acid adenylation domain-containing protein, partial [Verrucomicrobiae bacterium]
WEELLGVAQVGVEDNFFQLGGHSLLATQLVSRIRDACGVELRLQCLFDTPTVAGLAGALEAATPQQKSVRPLRPVPREGELPLSFAQQRLWFLEQLEPGCCAYNIPDAVRLSGWLDVAALEQSVSEIVRRHESLRTTFLCREGRPVQVIAPPRPVHLPMVELRQVPGRAQEIEVQRLVAHEARTPFGLARGPLLRATLLRLADDEHVLLLTMHHIVSDGWSMGVLFQELALLYKAFVQGKLPTLAELPVQYADYAVWQRDWLRGEVLERQLCYWRKKLTGAPAVLELPTDRPRPAIQSFRGATLPWRLPKKLSDSIKALARQEDATLFMALLAAFQTLLHRYTSQEDILIGSPIAGRNRAETEGLIGFFVNTLVLRGDLSGEPGFRELLRRARAVALEAYAHQDLPFEKLVEELQPERTLSHNPLFQVAFVLQNAPLESFDLPGLKLEPLPVDSGSVQFELTLSMEETEQGLKGLLEYNTDLFDAATMTRLLEHFQSLLEGIVAAPDQPISTLPLLGQSERRRLLTEWNDTRVDYPRDRCIHELFEAEAERRPEAVAVVFEGKQLTYGELNRRANQLAHYLRKLGLRPELMAGICVERSLEMIVGLLGILKAGGAYVPLDPNYPKERLAFMLEDTRVPVLLTQQRLLDALPKPPAKVICLDRDWGVIAKESGANVPSGATAESLAYVIYTSGSTGRPNGVMTPHRGVVRLVKGANYAEFGPTEVFLQFATLSFDASTFEIWGALLNGARLAVFPARPPTLEELGRTLQRHQVTTLWLTAGLFHLMVDERPQDLKHVRQLLAGGDVLSVPHVKKLLQAQPQCRLINGYGPTESTTFTCCHTVRADDPSRASIPIGRPIANTHVHILDRHLQPAPAGVPGELYIGGDGLASGYLDRPELTARKFVPDPFTATPGARLYKSGDLARYLPDGTIEFLGRIDQQVKIRGYRVELEEIEGALARHPAVTQAAVLACSNRRGEKSLIAYVVLRRRSAVSMEELRRTLRQSLPDYMVPSAFLELESMPLTANGKVDRKALPQPEQLEPAARQQYVSPRDTLELQLTHLWENVLGRHSISVTDNFFECGGHSLLAVRLFAEIGKCLGKNLPLATLFQAPTIERLAAVLRQDGWTPPWSSLVAIQPGGSKPPFYCIHGVGGNVLSFHALAVHLGSDQPLYGLQSQGLDGNQLPQSRIEEMAAHYIKEIRTLQPKGPYAMGGMSFGGLVAYEMAQQLQAQGEKVALLALIDSFPLNQLGAVPERIDFLKRRIGHHWGQFARLGFREKLAYVQKKARTLQRKFKNRMWQMTYKFYQVIEHPLPHALQNVKEANFLAAQSYAPKLYPGQVTVFSSSEKGMAEYYDPQVIWGPLAGGGVQVHTIPGDHVTMIEEPHVRVLAQKLKVCLDATADQGSRTR